MSKRLEMMAMMMSGGGGEVNPLTIPLTIKALAAGRVAIWSITSYATISTVNVSVNGGDWLALSKPSADNAPWKHNGESYYINMSEGDTVAVKASGKWANNITGRIRFELQDSNGDKTGNAIFDVYGNIMSLSFGDDFVAATSLSTLGDYVWSNLFSGQTLLNSAEDLLLPAITLSDHCYKSMFEGCSNLIGAPALPAEAMTSGCYDSMFKGCTSLATAPMLSSTSLASKCYYMMFNGCSALTSAPSLPATTLESSCYSNMFLNCTSLVTAPVLPAITLVSGCYSSMFNGCSSLNYIKAMFTTEPSTSYTQTWVKNVASTGTFVMNASAEWSVSGQNGIPANWTIQTANE